MSDSNRSLQARRLFQSLPVHNIRVYLVMNQPQLLHANVSEQAIKAFYHVYNTLGHGFLEKVYENSMANALRKRGLDVMQQVPIKVFFEGDLVLQRSVEVCVRWRPIAS